MWQFSDEAPSGEERESRARAPRERTVAPEVQATAEPPATQAVTPTPAPTPTAEPTVSPTPSLTPPPAEPPRLMVEKSLSSGEAAELEHPMGARIVIPAGAAGPVIAGIPGGVDPAISGVSQEFSVVIEESEGPRSNPLEVQSVFGITVVDGDGNDVPLREPVEITLPEGKTVEDLLVVYWDEQLGRWERVEGAVVNENDQTVSVRTDHLTDVGPTLYLSPMHALATMSLSLIGIDALGALYESGYKFALTFRGDVTIPLKFVGAKLGASLSLDLNDILSLTNLAPQDSLARTVEGSDGYFTFGLNGHLAVTDTVPKVSGSMKFSTPYRDEYGTTGYNNDLSFDASISVGSVSLFGGLVGLEGPTLNENGNIDPIDLQIDTCPKCTLSIGGAEGSLYDVELLPTTLNLAKGEFNTNFGEVVGNIAEGKCSKFPCKLSWATFIEYFLDRIINGPIQQTFELGKDIGLIYQYTDFEHENPKTAAEIGYGFVNQVEAFTGGADVNGDGQGDLVFPAGVPGGGAPHDLDHGR